MSNPETTTSRQLQHYRWLMVDALTHAQHVAARLQEATDGTDETLLFNDVRKAITEFRDGHPAMRALATAAFRNME